MRCFRSVQRLPLILACAAIAGAISAASHATGSAPGKPVLHWLLAGPAVAVLAANPEASRLLSGTRPFVARGRNTAIPPAWKAVPYASFKSVGELARALRAGPLGDLEGVMYDNEAWALTPPEEQRHPARYTKLAAGLAHGRRLLFLAAPAVDLVNVLMPGNGAQNRRYDAYLSLRLAAAARYADVFAIQAQSAERDTRLYADFVRRAAAQARRANPEVLVLAGISTNPNGQRVAAKDLLGAIAATRGTVDGYWLNVPRPGMHCPNCSEFRPDIAIDVLSALAGDR